MVRMTDTISIDPTEAICAFADELTSVLNLAKSFLESGRTIDMTGFTDQVGLLCAKSLDLPPDEGRRIRPRLIVLSGSIEALSRALQKAAPCSSVPPLS
jgi:hypothetical protein